MAAYQISHTIVLIQYPMCIEPAILWLELLGGSETARQMASQKFLLAATKGAARCKLLNARLEARRDDAGHSPQFRRRPRRLRTVTRFAVHLSESTRRCGDRESWIRLRRTEPPPTMAWFDDDSNEGRG